MNLSDQLGYRHRSHGPIRRGVAVLAATKAVSALLSHFIQGLDRATSNLSRGRITATELLTGLPVLWVTTTGARSGELRTVPLLGFPLGDGVSLIGTRFGTAHTPGWVFNLLANPDATVRWRDTEVAATARRLTEDEAVPVWETAAELYPGYRYYRERASHRKIEVFLLETA